IDAATIVDQGTIGDARHPDVVIGDDLNGPFANGGTARVIIVYENTSTQDIEFDYLDVYDCMGFGSPSSLGLGGPTVVSSGDSAFYPHIDAFFADPAGPKYFSGLTPPDYIELGEFVITWTEKVSTVDKIFVEDGVFNSGGAPVLNGN